MRRWLHILNGRARYRGTAAASIWRFDDNPNRINRRIDAFANEFDAFRPCNALDGRKLGE